MLAWRDSLRTMEWGSVFPYSGVTLNQIRGLVAIVVE